MKGRWIRLHPHSKSPREGEEHQSLPPFRGFALKPRNTELFWGNCFFCPKTPKDWLKVQFVDALNQHADVMVEEAATAGFYEPTHFPGLRFPRLQILTIEELLEGGEIEYPRLAPTATFRRAKRRRTSQQEQLI